MCWGPSEPTRQPTDYATIFRQPPECTDHTDCDIFIGMEPNEHDATYLDVYMQGEAAAYLAVGFSNTEDMVRILLAYINNGVLLFITNGRQQYSLDKKKKKKKKLS